VNYYAVSARRAPFTRQDVLAGRVIRISPALITITDGRVDTDSSTDLQRDVQARVTNLLDHGVRSFHVDINFDDYSAFEGGGPDRNAAVFTPGFIAQLNETVRARDAFLTLHLLTDQPAHYLRAFEAIPLGAICFQLDAVTDAARLAELVDQIGGIGACASPVIETVGTDRLIPLPPEAMRAQLDPVLPRIGMLTFQAVGTASRSNLPAGAFDCEQVAAYLAPFSPAFGGTIQIQGGITTDTIGAAAALGADFVVVGTQVFRNRAGLAPVDVIDSLLQAAAAGMRHTF
jgi:pentose-5-phosphate-3-epimerase